MMNMARILLTVLLLFGLLPCGGTERDTQSSEQKGEISLRAESGAPTMYAVAEKENPRKITVLEHASREACDRHIATVHFQKYRQETLNMVDVHTHIIIPEYLEMLKAHGAELEETFPLPGWDVGRHIAFMDSAGIRTAVLTMPAPQPYYGDAEKSAKCIRRVNEVSAKVKQQYPDRFKFCAALPLPNVDAAIREAIYALDTLGADGVKLATNSRGQYLGDEALDPLMEVLNERHAVIIIHPHRPTPYPEKIIATTPLAMYEYPAETTRAVVNMLARNVLVRYPNLKVIVPHCGSFLPLALPRMKSILPAMVQQGYMQPIDWTGNLSRLYFDLAGSPSVEVLRSLLTITSPDHILYGSDYPYLPDAVLKDNLQRMKQMLASDKELAGYANMFLWENAESLFVKDVTSDNIPTE